MLYCSKQKSTKSGIKDYIVSSILKNTPKRLFYENKGAEKCKRNNPTGI